jgi:ribonuclease HII
MGFLIGTDEAGYGPNLGPLVITATVWQLADHDLERVDLYQQLAPAVDRQLDCGDDRIAIADSKRLFRPGGSLSALERGVLSTLRVSAGELPLRWRRLWQLLCPGALDEMAGLPWYQEYDGPFPREVSATCVEQLATRLQSLLDDCGVRLILMRATALFPAQFNRLVEQYDSKGLVLSQTTLNLICDILSGLAPESVNIVCDKHGGRDHYAGLLQPRFADRLVRVAHEGRAESLYDVGTAERPVRISFRAKGEAFLPSALASMVSKYLRELSMAAFNTFWQQHVQDLKPTAGYPMDARRFRSQIAVAQNQLGIDDQHLWRVR